MFVSGASTRRDFRRQALQCIIHLVYLVEGKHGKVCGLQHEARYRRKASVDFEHTKGMLGCRTRGRLSLLKVISENVIFAMTAQKERGLLAVRKNRRNQTLHAVK